jgi:poly(3-hydroxybutyrate) depolymerase
MKLLLFKRILLSFVLLAALGFRLNDNYGIANAQSYQPYANLFEKRSLTKEGKTLPYRLMKPKNYDASKHYPLHITLHGAPERGNNNETQVGITSLCVAPWAVDSERTSRPAFVLAPQCPSGQEWIGVHWGSCGAKLPPVSSMAWPGRFVLDLIDSICIEFPSIDTNRIYISGGSMGGVGTWYLCQYRPERFAAAFPICGSGDTTLPDAFVKIPLWTFAGTADYEVPYTATRAMVAAIKRAGGKPHYTEVPGEGHTNKLIGGAAQNHEVHVWLFNQTKKSTTIQFLINNDKQHNTIPASYSCFITGIQNKIRSTREITYIYDFLGRNFMPSNNIGYTKKQSTTGIFIYKTNNSCNVKN